MKSEVPEMHSSGKRRNVSQNGASLAASTGLLVKAFMLLSFAVLFGECEDCKCGLEVTERISYGGRITGGTYPWMCIILTDGYNPMFCAATLIARQFVITSSPCFPRGDDRRRYVVCDVQNLQSAQESGDKVYVEKYWNLEDSEDDRGKAIAVVKLEEKIDRMPICLPQTDNTYQGEYCKILGYGQTELWDSFGILKEGIVIVPSDEECKEVEEIYPKEMCAGMYKGQPGFCPGDSGGPLQCRNKSGRWELVGIFYGARGCKKDDGYGIFTRVSDHLKWIQEKIDGRGCVM